MELVPFTNRQWLKALKIKQKERCLNSYEKRIKLEPLIISTHKSQIEKGLVRGQRTRWSNIVETERGTLLGKNGKER